MTEVHHGASFNRGARTPGTPAIGPVAVLGATGQVGRHVVTGLAQRGQEFTAAGTVRFDGADIARALAWDGPALTVRTPMASHYALAASRSAASTSPNSQPRERYG